MRLIELLSQWAFKARVSRFNRTLARRAAEERALNSPEKAWKDLEMMYLFSPEADAPDAPTVLA